MKAPAGVVPCRGFSFHDRLVSGMGLAMDRPRQHPLSGHLFGLKLLRFLSQLFNRLSELRHDNGIGAAG
jgi:hypothetical protein